VSKEEVMTKAADAAVLLLTSRVEREGYGQPGDVMINDLNVGEVHDEDVDMAL